MLVLVIYFSLESKSVSFTVFDQGAKSYNTLSSPENVNAKNVIYNRIFCSVFKKGKYSISNGL